MISKVIFTFEKYLTQVEEIVGEELEQSDVEKIVYLQQMDPKLKSETIDYMKSIGYNHNTQKIKLKNNKKFYETFIME